MRLHQSRNLPLLAALLTLLCFFASGKVRAEEAKKIDLPATTNYVKNWAARDAFPDSPSFAYQNVFCQLVLGGRVNDADRSRIIEFLKKCQNSDGGFGTAPDLKDSSNVIFTYFALAALDLLDAPSAVNREKAVGFVLSLASEGGGMKAAAKDRTPNIGATYYSVRALSLLKALDRIDKSKTMSFIKSHRDDGRGFGVLPGKPSAVQPTFMAVYSLKLLGGLTDDIGPGVMEYLKETPYSGLREPENLALVTMDNQVCVLETATILSAMQQLNKEKIHEFVESLYIPENGGFGPGPSLGATPPATYDGLRCLVWLGTLKDPYSTRQ